MHLNISCNEFGIASRCFTVIETSFSEIGGRLLAKCEASGHMSELKPHFSDAKRRPGGSHTHTAAAEHDVYC